MLRNKENDYRKQAVIPEGISRFYVLVKSYIRVTEQQQATWEVMTRENADGNNLFLVIKGFRIAD